MLSAARSPWALPKPAFHLNSSLRPCQSLRGCLHDQGSEPKLWDARGTRSCIRVHGSGALALEDYNSYNIKINESDKYNIQILPEVFRPLLCSPWTRYSMYTLGLGHRPVKSDFMFYISSRVRFSPDSGKICTNFYLYYFCAILFVCASVLHKFWM